MNGSEANAGDTVDLRDVISILRRRIRLILLTIAIILSLAFLYLARTTPLYTATTLLLVDPAQKDLLQPTQDGSLNASLASSAIESEVEILRSDTVLLRMIAQTGLMQDKEFGPSLSFFAKFKQAIGLESATPDSKKLLAHTLAKVKTATGARRKGLTNLIALTFTSKSPENAAKDANALAQTYIRMQVDSKASNFLNAKSVLEGQLSTAQAALTGSDGALNDFIDHNLARLEQESGSAAVTDLRKKLESAKSARLQAQAKVADASSALASGDWAALADTLQQQALSALANQRRALANRLGNTEAGSDTAIQLRTALSKVEDQLATRGQAAVSSLQSNVADLQSSSDELHQQLRQELVSSNLSPELLTQIYGLQQEATIAQRQYDTLLNRIRDLQTQATVQVADTRVVSDAIAPSKPSFPKKNMILALALIAATGVGIGLAYLSEFFVGGINSQNQLANVTGTRFGTVIPKTTPGGQQISPADAVIDAPMAQFSESLRRLRANIDRFAPAQRDQSQVIMVTSAIPAEGKSVTALGLARTYAAAGKRALIIDADMRKPTLHKQLGIDPISGLFEYLTQAGDDPSECFDVDPRSGVGVILGRDRPGVPTDQLLQSDLFVFLIEDAKNTFDVIIIDTPPLLPVVDARYIAPLVDCAVLCVRAGETSQGDVRAAYEQLVDSLNEDSVVVPVLTFESRRESTYKYSGYYY